jgi:hypothetical protein
MHPHLSREAIVLDVETTRYGRTYVGRRVKITHVEKDPSTGGAVGYVVRMEEGGDELPRGLFAVHVSDGKTRGSGVPESEKVGQRRTRGVSAR